MEKIYMEEKNSQNNRKGMFNFSIVLSFAVAIFAVISLASAGIAINQGTGVSYAMPTEDVTTFNLRYVQMIAKTEASGGKQMAAEVYYANDTTTLDNMVLCIERKYDTTQGEGYTQTTAIRDGEPDIKSDPGLLYLLGFAQSNEAKNISNTGVEVLDGFIIQSAVWYYLAEKYPSVAAFQLYDGTSEGQSNLKDKDVLDKEDIMVEVNGTTKAVKTTKIHELVENAKKAEEPKVTAVKENDEISKTEDGKYYQSALVTVVGSPATSFIKYEVSLEGVEGATLVDQNGQALDLTNVPAGKNFYVRIPADKLTKNEKQTVKINVKGHFNAGQAVYYRPTNESTPPHQMLVSVKPDTKDATVDVEFITSDDTGMKAFQTIYFIGLIVLLCGVGIVYANARPAESK